MTSPDRSTSQASASAAPRPEITLAEFQQLIRRMYLEKDIARGIDGTFMWLMEEVGELAAVCQGYASRADGRVRRRAGLAGHDRQRGGRGPHARRWWRNTAPVAPAAAGSCAGVPTRESHESISSCRPANCKLQIGNLKFAILFLHFSSGFRPVAAVAAAGIAWQRLQGRPSSWGFGWEWAIGTRSGCGPRWKLSSAAAARPFPARCRSS